MPGLEKGPLLTLLNPFACPPTVSGVYIVRDPRNVVTSYSKHFKKTKEQSVSDITNELIIGVKSKTHPPTYVGSWNFHYNSWKQLNKSNRYMLVKYEDLLKDPEKILVDVLNFIYRLGKSNISIDKKKLSNSITSTDFEKMQCQETWAHVLGNKNQFDLSTITLVPYKFCVGLI